jgi:hypothetical protein
MATSAVPAAVDALLAILRAAPGLVDGPPSTSLTDRKRIHVGWQSGTDAAVALEQDFAYAGARRRDEAFEISCYAETRGDGKEMVLQRAAVFELVAAVETALRATDAAPTAPTLNGTVLWAHLTTGNLSQAQAEGTVCGLAFTITCQARI